MDLDTAEQAETRAEEDARQRIIKFAVEHINSRRLRETSQGIENKYKEKLKDELVQFGEETPEGHYVYDFPEGVGLSDGRVLLGLKREKRASLVLDTDLLQDALPDKVLAEVTRVDVSFNDLPDGEYEALQDILAGTEFDLHGSGNAQISSYIDEDTLLGMAYDDDELDALLKSAYSESSPTYALKVNYGKA